MSSGQRKGVTQKRHATQILKRKKVDFIKRLLVELGVNTKEAEYFKKNFSVKAFSDTASVSDVRYTITHNLTGRRVTIGNNSKIGLLVEFKKLLEKVDAER